jgi:hypothetical protein
MDESRVGYTKGLVTEFIRFSKAFNNTVHVVPFLPPPLFGTNNPELLRAMMDVSMWIEKLQKFKLSDYYSELRAYIIANSDGGEQSFQNTQRHKMPKAFEAYNDKTFMCHEWVGLSSSLPQMDQTGEAGLLSLVISNLAATFRWKLDEKPDFCRSSGSGPANSAAVLPTSLPAPLGVLISGSNTFRLQKAFDDMGKPVEAMVASRWAITMGSVDSLLPNLDAILA